MTRVKIRQLIIIISFVGLFMSIMGTGFYVLWRKVSPPDPQVELEEEKGTEKEEGKAEEKPLCTLDTFVVNLSDRGVTRFLRTTIVLELTSEEAGAEMEGRLSQIRNAILMVLPGKSSKDIITVDGKTALSDEIMSELNYILKDGSISNIFFTEFIIQ